MTLQKVTQTDKATEHTVTERKAIQMDTVPMRDRDVLALPEG